MQRDTQRLGSEDEIRKLAEHLRSFDLGPEYVGKHDESLYALVRGLADIEESCQAFRQDLLPRLIGSAEAVDARNALFEIQQELKHIIWHLADMDLTRELLRLRWLDEGGPSSNDPD
jgi:hypothetical protein